MYLHTAEILIWTCVYQAMAIIYSSLKIYTTMMFKYAFWAIRSKQLFGKFKLLQQVTKELNKKDELRII